MFSGNICIIGKEKKCLFHNIFGQQNFCIITSFGDSVNRILITSVVFMMMDEILGSKG
jgi:hypothetical protein